jgi:hypothetical protein
LKAEIIGDLKLFGELRPNARFFVFIDDLDRLEPDEAMEILRLVRKVADFPLIVYVTCFDQKILSRYVRKSLGVDGIEFIEKIFQNVISVPPQEPFALRRYFQKLLYQAFPEYMTKNDVSDLRLETRRGFLFDIWAGTLLKTPRDVIRVCDAIIFGWPHAEDGADFLDFVWLQLIKIKAPELYGWTQNYVAETGSFRDGGVVDGEAAKREARRLAKILERIGWSGNRVLHSGIDEFLPGLKNFTFESEDSKVFSFDDEDIASFEERKRLGSPSHWRRYFAFDKPSYAIDDDEIATFRRIAVDNYLEAARYLGELGRNSRGRRWNLVRVLLERLTGLSEERVTGEERRAFALVFANIMDSFAHQREKDEFGTNAIWRLSERLLNQANDEDFLQLVGSGFSINWLAFVIRRQGFARGRPTGESSPARMWLSASNFESAVEILVDRFRRLGAEIFRMPEPAHILYCWLQLGDEAELREFIASNTASDRSFLDFLSALRGWVHSSNRGIYYPLSRHAVANFVDAASAKLRLDKIRNSDADDELKGVAEELNEAWVEKEEY